MSSTKLAFAASIRRRGGDRRRCGHVGARRLGYSPRPRIIRLRRWVTPITASAMLLALTTGFIWMIDAPLQHDHLIFIYLRPDRADRHPLRQHFRHVRGDRQHFCRSLFPLRAALQFQGGEPARPARTHLLQPAGVAREPSGVRLCQGQRCRAAASAAPRGAVARAMAVDGGALGKPGCWPSRDPIKTSDRSGPSCRRRGRSPAWPARGPC